MNKFITSTLVFIFFGLTINAQSSKSTIVVENDDHKYELKILDGEIIKFQVDGKKIKKEDYELYSEILQSLQERQPTAPTPPAPPSPPSNARTAEQITSDAKTNSEHYRQELEHKNRPEPSTDTNDELALAIKEMLIKSGDLTNLERYKIKLKKDGLTLDGKRLSSELFETAKSIYKNITDHEFNNRTKVYIKRKKNSASTSIVRKEGVTVDYEIE